MKPYPRANTSEGDGIALSPELYNRIVEDIERLDRLSVMPPLSMTSGGSGSTISLQGSADELVLVAIIGTETGGGRYQGTILRGLSTGKTSNNFQLEPFPSQSATDGPVRDRTASGTGSVNNALVINLREPAVNGSHMLWASVTPQYYAVGRVMGMTSESRPRTIVYIDGWPLVPVIAKITGRISSDYGGTYYGRMLQGQFASGSILGSAFPLSSVSSSYLPSVDTCWITNNWEQTYGAARWTIPTGTFVWGMMAGFPLYSVVSGATSNNTWFQVYTWFPVQSAALAHPIANLTTSQSPGTVYTNNEQAMLNALKTDLTNLRASLADLYGNLQHAGYSL